MKKMLKLIMKKNMIKNMMQRIIPFFLIGWNISKDPSYVKEIVEKTPTIHADVSHGVDRYVKELVSGKSFFAFFTRFSQILGKSAFIYIYSTFGRLGMILVMIQLSNINLFSLKFAWGLYLLYEFYKLVPELAKTISSIFIIFDWDNPFLSSPHIGKWERISFRVGFLFYVFIHLIAVSSKIVFQLIIFDNYFSDQPLLNLGYKMKCIIEGEDQDSTLGRLFSNLVLAIIMYLFLGFDR